MEAKDLIIGKEYYFDGTKTEKGVYIGFRKKSNGIYFNPIGKTTYLLSSVEDPEFKKMVGVMNALTI